MCISLCVCICVSVNLYLNVCIFVHLYLCMYVCMYVPCAYVPDNFLVGSIVGVVKKIRYDRLSKRRVGLTEHQESCYVHVSAISDS